MAAVGPAAACLLILRCGGGRVKFGLQRLPIGGLLVLPVDARWQQRRRVRKEKHDRFCGLVTSPVEYLHRAIPGNTAHTLCGQTGRHTRHGPRTRADTWRAGRSVQGAGRRVADTVREAGTQWRLTDGAGEEAAQSWFSHSWHCRTQLRVSCGVSFATLHQGDIKQRQRAAPQRPDTTANQGSPQPTGAAHRDVRPISASDDVRPTNQRRRRPPPSQSDAPNRRETNQGRRSERRPHIVRHFRRCCQIS